MSRHNSRKNSQKTRHYKSPRKPLPVTSVPWLPGPEAGFLERASAVNRARAECDEIRRFRPRNVTPYAPYERALQVYWLALSLLYPPEFWSGYGDLLAGKSNQVDLYIEFLEGDPFCFRTGYVKAELLLGLKRITLIQNQQERLRNVILMVIEKGDRREFRSYCRLARKIQTPEWLAELEERLLSQESGVARRAGWVLAACHQKL